MCFAMEEMKMTICAMIQKCRFYPVEETPVPKVFCIVCGHLKSEYCSKFNQIHLRCVIILFSNAKQLNNCRHVKLWDRDKMLDSASYSCGPILLYYCSSLKMSDMCYLQRITLKCHLFQWPGTYFTILSHYPIDNLERSCKGRSDWFCLFSFMKHKPLAPLQWNFWMFSFRLLRG
jgi:hypothetical protein